MRQLFILFLIFPVLCHSQTAYKTGDVVSDLPIAKMLNHSSSSSTLKKIQHTITIIDFFGTWCAPCIKALPELAAYKNKFKDDISILLVSTEAEAKLTKFISSRQPFAFPMVVDEDSRFTNAFSPPSYPYTIVLDKNLKVLSITNAADLTEAALVKFIEDAKIITQTKAVEPTITDKPKTVEAPKVYTGSNNTLVKLSQDFMYAAKTNEPTAAYINNLQQLNYNELLTGLKTDDDKKAFWINLYNAYTNASLHANPDQYKSRNKFFKNKNIVVAGKTFSFDNIEHGLLRRSSIKWSLGYFSKLFPNKTEIDLRVDKLDCRIHFALNCGAKSCPPIAFYNPENLNTQLDIATTAYLSSETNYDTATNILKLPALLNWFRRDFGGKQKMIELLKSKQLLAADVNPKIRFKKYDWTLYLDNYKQ
jgi:thiol-disulfide isomerase/thioredoxin